MKTAEKYIELFGAAQLTDDQILHDLCVVIHPKDVDYGIIFNPHLEGPSTVIVFKDPESAAEFQALWPEIELLVDSSSGDETGE